jgi:hypothetical protein
MLLEQTLYGSTNNVEPFSVDKILCLLNETTNIGACTSETVLYVSNLPELGNIFLRDQTARTGAVSIGSDSREENSVLLVSGSGMGENRPSTYFSG